MDCRVKPGNDGLTVRLERPDVPAKYDVELIGSPSVRRDACGRQYFAAHTAGELLLLLGPSGCGKTSTLRMVPGTSRSRMATS